MTLPVTYNRRLQRFDPLLRMRWSQQREQWILERKYRRAQWSIGTVVSDDAAIQLRDGYLELGTYDPRGLPLVDRLIDYLGKMDTWRMGYSPEQFADVYETHAEVKDEARERSIQRRFRDRASDTWEDVCALNGNRSYPKHTGFR